MDYTKNNLSLLAILSLLFAGVLFFCIWTPNNIRPFFSIQTNPSRSSNSKICIDELEGALKKASTEDKTAIIAVVNKAYVERQEDYSKPSMLDLFLESFWIGEDTRPLLDHLLVVAVDQTAYDRCKFRRLHCYRLVTDGVDFTGEKVYMSDDFINMMWRRTLFLLDVLNLGYNFIFTDIDVMWLRNPFLRLSRDKNEDLQISTDSFRGNPWSTNNVINTGFYHIISNPKTISLFQIWYGMKNNSTGMKEQDVLASLMHKGVFGKLGLKVRFLDTLYFSGFCSDSKDVRLVTTVHANCCRSIRAKVADLIAVLQDWKKFNGSMASEAIRVGNGTQTFLWSKHIACSNSWKVPIKN